MATTRRRRKKPEVQEVEGTKKVWVKPFKNSTEEIETVEKEVHIFETDPAFVRVSAGMTVNLGDYESLRVDVAVTMPCYAEMVDETQQEIGAWVQDRLQNEIDEYTKP